jgi:hypothetical protein
MMSDRNTLRSARLLGAAAAVLALLAVDSTSAQQPGGAPAARPTAATTSAMPIDRTKILTAPNVFGVFLTYKVRPDWGRADRRGRRGACGRRQA